MRLGRVWYILYCFVFLCSLVGYPQVSEGEGLVSLIGLDLSKKGEIGFIFSQDKVDKDYAKEYPLKYFFTSLVVPNDELWVNLSPRLGDTEIIGEGISNTDLGRLMLYYDLKLKHDVEKLLKIYGDEIDEYMENLGKDVNLRFWIEPGVVEMEVDGRKGIIKSAPLEVRVEVDGMGGEGLKNWLEREVAAVVRERVNRGEGYARLRQAYNSMILAQWYKRHIRKGMVFSEYVDSRAKGEGIISDGVWFRSAYLEEYVRMYLGENSEDEGWASVVVGGIRGEVKKIEEMPGNVPYRSVRSAIRVSDGNRLVSEVKKAIEEIGGWEKGNDVDVDPMELDGVIDDFLNTWYTERVRSFRSGENMSDLWEKYANRAVVHQRCEEEDQGGEISNSFEIIPPNGELLVVGNMSSFENLREVLEVFRDRLKKGRNIKLVFFVESSWINKYCRDDIIPAPLYIFLRLYKEMPDRIILLGGKDGLEKVEENKGMVQRQALFAFVLQTLPSFAIIAPNRILIDGGIAEIKQNIKVEDVERGQLSNYLEVDNYALISFYGREVKIRYPALDERISAENRGDVVNKVAHGELGKSGLIPKTFSTKNKKVNFEGSALERIIDVLNGKVRNVRTYLLIDRDNAGNILVSLYNPERSYEVGPKAAVVEINEQGISPGFLYAQTGVVGKTLSPMSADTWKLIPTIYETIDKEIRNRYYWDKEQIAKNINIKGVYEVRLRGMSEDVLVKEIKNILNYMGKRDIYMWISTGSIRRKGCVLKFQFYRPVLYRGGEERWALVKFNHINGQIEVVRSGVLTEETIYGVIREIKRAFIRSNPPLGEYSHITFRERPNIDTWIIGKEFFLEEGMRLSLDSWLSEMTISRERDGMRLSIIDGSVSRKSNSVARIIKVPKSERVFLDRRFNKVEALKDASFIVELGKDDFVRVITLSKRGLLMSTHARINAIDIRDKEGVVIGYKGGRKDRIRRVIVECRDSEVVIRKAGGTIEINKPRGENVVLLDSNFDPTNDRSKTKFELLFENKRVSIRGFRSDILVPMIHMRDIVYKNRDEYYIVPSYKLSEDNKFYFSLVSRFDGFIMTKGTEEYIIVDWNRDDKLKRLYKDVVKRLIQTLREDGNLRLSGEELRRFENALVRADRTEVEKFVSKVMTGRAKSQLISYVYRAIEEKVEYGDVDRNCGELFFIGDSIGANGVCRHTAILTSAILEKLTETGFLLGKAYWIGIPGHAFSVYVTSRGIPIVFDIAQEVFSPVSRDFDEVVEGSFSEEEVFKIGYKQVLKKVGLRIPRSIESRIDNGISTLLSGLNSHQIGNCVAFVSFDTGLNGRGGIDCILRVQDIGSKELISIGAREEDGNRVRQFLELLRGERSSLAKLLLRNWSEVSQKLRFYVIEDQGKDKRRFKDFFGWGGDGKVVVSSALLERIDNEKTKGLLWLHEILEALVSMGIAEIGVDGENVYMKMGAETLEFKASKERLKQLLFEKLLPGKGGVAHYLIYELEEEDIGNVSRDLTKAIRQEKQERGVGDNDKWWRKNIEVLDRGVPEVVKKVLYDRFSSGRWSEGAVLDVVRYLYGQENAGISEKRVDDWGKMKGDIVERVDKVLGEKARDGFLRTWEKIDTDTRLDVARKRFRFLSLMYEYKVYAIVPVIYESVLKQAGEIFEKWVKSGDVNKIRESMDDLAWYSKNKVGMMGRKDVGKGGLVLSLKSLILS